MFGPDGTQAPPPPRVFPDPLAGLIAADTFVARPLTKITAPPQPPQPTEQMRQAIAEQMAREQRHAAVRPRQKPRPPQRPHIPPAMPAMPVAVPPAPQQAQQQQQQTSGVATFVGCLIILLVLGGLAAGVIAFLGALFS